MGHSSVIEIGKQGSLDQPQHLASIHPIERVNDIVPVEYHEKPFNGPRCVSRPFEVFPEDAPCVLDCAQDRVLVGVIHDAIHSADRIQRRNAALVPEHHPYTASLIGAPRTSPIFQALISRVTVPTNSWPARPLLQAPITEAGPCVPGDSPERRMRVRPTGNAPAMKLTFFAELFD